MAALRYESTATVLEPVRERSARIWFGIVGLCVAQFLVMFESMAGLAALTTAQLDVGVGADTGDPLITAYGTVLAGLLWFGGRIADRIGLDRALVIGGVGFAGLALLGTFAQNGESWFAARAGQAVFAALLLPAVLALITVLCQLPGLRAKVLTAYCAMTMAGMAVGYSYGATLLPTEPTSWQRPMFIVAAGIVAALLVSAPALVGIRRVGDPGSVGIAALVPGVGAIVVGFALAAADGWTAPRTMVTLGAGTLLVAAAYFTAARKPANWPGPVPKPTRRGVTLGVVILQAGAWGIIFPLYQLQYVMMHDIETGALEMAPYVASLLVFAIPALLWAHRAGPRLPIVLGLVWTGVCLGMLSLLKTTSTYSVEALPVLALVGAGVMAAFVAATLTALAGSTDNQAGRFGARWSGLIQLGVVTGAGVLGTVKKQTGERVADGRSVADPEVLETAYHNALIVGCVLSILGAALVWVVLRPVAPAVPAHQRAVVHTPVTGARAVEPVPASAPPLDYAPVAACAIVGSVRTAGGVPLPAVVLTLVDPAGREMGRTTTDAGGNYRMDTPDGGDFMMVCAGTAAFDPSAGLVTVYSGIRRHDVVLRGGSAIFGHVRAGTRAVPGATVTLTDGDGSVHAAVETGLDGHFDIDGLVAGRYTLSAVTPGLAPVAQTVELPAGRVHHDLVLADVAVGNGRRPGHPLGGVVRSARSDRGVPWALVTLVDPAGNSLLSTRTGPDGVFRFDRVPVGPYRLTTTIYHQESVSVEFAGPDTEDTVIMIDRDGQWTEAEAEELLS